MATRDGFIDVYRSDNGDKVEIPAGWMEHPLLSKPFRKTPLQKRADAKAEASKTTTQTPAKGA